MDLDSFLQSRRAEGTLDSRGTFAIDFNKAREKRKNYTLPRPELWIIRLLQGFAALHARTVEITLTRKELLVSVDLESELPASRSLSDLFRLPSPSDPRQPLQDAVWGSVNRDLTVRVGWKEGSRHLGFSIDEENIEMLQEVSEARNDALNFRFCTRHQGGLLYRMFGKADFSAEFVAVARAGFLAPYTLLLDGRPYDFEAGHSAKLWDDHEVRVQPAISGPRIRVSPGVRHLVSCPDATTPGLPQVTEYEEFDYLFLLSAGWREFPRKPRVHWVADGFVVDSRPLRERESSLHVDLYLPAEGLQTDLTNFHLVHDQAYQERLRQLDDFACYSLITNPIEQLANQPEAARIEQSVKEFVKPFLDRRAYLKKEIRPMPDRIEEHLKKHRSRAKPVARDEHRLRRSATKLGVTLAEARLMMARWSKKYNVGDTIREDELPLFGGGEAPEFFGEVYIRLPGVRE